MIDTRRWVLLKQPVSSGSEFVRSRAHSHAMSKHNHTPNINNSKHRLQADTPQQLSIQTHRQHHTVADARHPNDVTGIEFPDNPLTHWPDTTRHRLQNLTDARRPPELQSYDVDLPSDRTSPLGENR